MMFFLFTFYPSPFTMCYPLTVIYGQWLMPALRSLGEGGANGECTENGEWLIVNGPREGAS